MSVRTACLAAVLSYLAAACGGGGNGADGSAETLPPPPAPVSDVALSWDHARVYLPFSSTPTSVDQLDSAPPSRVAVFLHGCTGLDSPDTIGTDQDWGTFLAQQGYIVIMPDSMARPSRQGVLTCNPATFERGLNMWIYDLRIEEANFALRKVLDARWYDGSRLILGGHSEGAATVYRSTYDGASDLVMSGFWCAPGVTRAKPAQAVFYLNWSKDPWYYTGGAPFDGAQCLVPGYRITSVTVSGAFHDGLTDPVAKQDAAAFAGPTGEPSHGP